jgi:uridylate kinase
MKKSLVISVGGSLIVPAEGIDIKWLKEFRAFILKKAKKYQKIYLVSGGGSIARNYIKAAKDIFPVNHENNNWANTRDWLGISATKLNAQLIKTIFGSLAYQEVVVDPTVAVKTNKKIIIAAGYKPGWSTDYDAVLIAKNNQASTVINLSNIDFVYEKDPRQFPEAKRIENISWANFQKIVGTKWHPGLNAPFDPIASREAKKSGLKVIILNGKNIKNLENCLEGKDFKGTTVE